MKKNAHILSSNLVYSDILNLTKLVFSLLLFSVMTFTSVYSNEHVEINLNVKNDLGNTSSYNFSFGISPTATDVLDKHLDELNLPPASPFGFYTAFEFIDSTQIEPDGSKYYDKIWTNKDLRHFPDTLDYYYVKHKLIFRFGQGKKILINWNNDNFSNLIDSIFIKDAMNGLVINYDMKKENSMEWSNDGILDLYIHVYYNLKKTSVIDDVSEDFIVYPNPVNNTLSIKSDYDRLELVDFLGNIVLRTDYTQSLNISNVPVGVYFAKVFTGNTVRVHRIVKN